MQEGISEVPLPSPVTLWHQSPRQVFVPLRGHLSLNCFIPNPSWSSEPPKIPYCTPRSPLRAQGGSCAPFPAAFPPKRGFWHLFLSSIIPLLALTLPRSQNPPVFIQQSPWLKLPLVCFLPFNKYIYIYSLNSTFMCVYIYLSNALTKQNFSFEEGTWS